MPDITIIKLKIRRGTDAQRRTITLEQGELGYATDTRRVFVGDGVTKGGVPISVINHPPIQRPEDLTSQANAVLNDFIYAGSYLYQLTAADFTDFNSWGRISNNTKGDNVTIDYINVGGSDLLQIKDYSITGIKLNESVAFNQGGLSASNNGLSINIDNSTLGITTTNILSVISIDERHVNSSAVTNGLTGGSGEKIGINISSYFNFNSDNALSLSALPNNSVSFNTIDQSIIGRGLRIESDQIAATILGAGGGLEEDGNGLLQLKNTLPAPGNSYFKTLQFNSAGQITDTSYSIAATLSCNTSSSILSVFNGHPSQGVYDSGFTTQTLLTALSTSSSDPSQSIQTVLTSAGFITFEGTFATDGTPVSRFAVPIFTY